MIVMTMHSISNTANMRFFMIAFLLPIGYLFPRFSRGNNKTGFVYHLLPFGRQFLVLDICGTYISLTVMGQSTIFKHSSHFIPISPSTPRTDGTAASSRSSP